MSPFTEPTGSRQALINLLLLLFPFGKHYLPPPVQYVLAGHSALFQQELLNGVCSPGRSLSSIPGMAEEDRQDQHWPSTTNQGICDLISRGSRAGEPGIYLGRAGRSNVIAQVFVSLEEWAETPWLSGLYLFPFQKMCKISSCHLFLQPDSIVCTTQTYPHNILV